MGGEGYPADVTIDSDRCFGGYKEICSSWKKVVEMPWRWPGGKGALSTGLLTDSIEEALNDLCWIRSRPRNFFVALLVMDVVISTLFRSFVAGQKLYDAMVVLLTEIEGPMWVAPELNDFL